MGSQADGGTAAARQAALQLVGEEQVGQLAAGVGAPAGIFTPAVEVIKIYHPAGVDQAGDGDDAGIRGSQKLVEQQTGEGEVTQVVDAELQLEAIDGLAVGGGHQTGVVDQDVQTRMLFGEGQGERTHGAQVGQVERAAIPGRPAESLSRMRRMADRPFSWSRQARMTWAPRAASARQV